jgi:hypothetical protein
VLDIYDLSGNVDEWCLTHWDEAGYSETTIPKRSSIALCAVDTTTTVFDLRAPPHGRGATLIQMTSTIPRAVSAW